MESCKLWFWKNRMKLLQTVTLIYVFLLSLLNEQLEEKIDRLLRTSCHRTGKRYKDAPLPLYRIKLAIANLLNLYFFAFLQNSG
jgi:diacylglycerol kinase